MEEIKKQIIKHDFAIENMAKSISELAETTKDSNAKLGDIAKSMGKQELILEKLTNLEANSKDNINRIHKRIDVIEEMAIELKKRGDVGKGCSALKIAQQEDETARTELKSNVKSNQHRLDKLESHLVWVSRSIVGTLITGIIGLVFYFAKS